MENKYLIHITNVDGEYYARGSSDKALVLAFLLYYDHEGSSLQLDISDEDCLTDNELIYGRLRS